MKFNEAESHGRADAANCCQPKVTNQQASASLCHGVRFVRDEGIWRGGQIQLVGQKVLPGYVKINSTAVRANKDTMMPSKTCLENFVTIQRPNQAPRGMRGITQAICRICW